MKNFGPAEILRLPVETEDNAASSVEEEVELNEDENSRATESEDEEEEEIKQTIPPEALQLYNALNNPATAAATLAYLNAKIPGGVTKSEIQDISLKDILKEGFGEEYAFLNDKLSPALEKAINHAIEAKFGKSLSSIQENLNQTRSELAQTKISAALDPIIEEMGAENFDKIAPALEKNMQKYPNQGQPMKSYIKDMIKLTKTSDPKKVEQITKNVRDARRNLASGASPEKVKIGSKTPTIREAVQLAMQGKQVED